MQVNGEPRKDHHKGKWEQVVQKATRSLQEMLRAASQRRRNVIIDQVGRHVSVLVWVCCALSSAVLNINITPTNRRIFVPDRKKTTTIENVELYSLYLLHYHSEQRHTQWNIDIRQPEQLPIPWKSSELLLKCMITGNLLTWYSVGPYDRFSIARLVSGIMVSPQKWDAS